MITEQTSRKSNKNLNDAKAAKKDEFYTLYQDVEKELVHYKDNFKNKIIYCNCDDTETSSFWKYFSENFDDLGLKKLVATHYHPKEPTYKIELNKHGGEAIKTKLSDNGDFRNKECIDILKDADVIVTNPPFSLFREFINQLIEHKKDFIVLGRTINVIYKNMFPLMKDRKINYGVNYNFATYFKIPEDYEAQKIDEQGNKYAKVTAISWFTTFDLENNEIFKDEHKHYNEEEYPKTDDGRCIICKSYKLLPCDYMGDIAVPITMFKKVNLDKYEIVGITENFSYGQIFLKKKKLYTKLIIRRII